MTRSLIARRTCAALLAGLTALLSACLGGGGGGGSSGNANLRTLNATGDLPLIDVYTDSDNRFPNVATGAVTDSQSLSAVTYTIKVTSAGNPTSLFTGAYSLSQDQHYTALVWGRNGSLKVATLPEDEDPAAISSGNSRVRVYNATVDAGAFDVYLTENVDDLSNATPVIAGAGSGSLTAFHDVSTGSYRLRITPAGDNAKVRLDVPAVTLGEKQYATIIVTAGTGGTLVNAGLLVQQGAFTPYPNTQARLRVVPGVDNNGSVSVQLDGQTVAANLHSPATVIPPYTLVNAGSRVVNVIVNGTSASTAPQNLVAGADYTLLVYGAPSAPLSQLIADDNRLPPSGRYKARLVNGAANSDPMTMTIDYAYVVSDLAPGVASPFVSGVPTTSSTGSLVQVSTLSSTLYTNTVNLQASGIYTLFMLGGNPTPAGVPVKEP